MITLMIVGALLGFVLLGVPIALALGSVGLVMFWQAGLPLQALPQIIYNSANSYVLSAIPLFMLKCA